MISAQIRKRFTYLYPRNASFLWEPHFSSSVAQHFFSTSTQKKGKQKDSTNSESVAVFLKGIGLSDAQLQKVFKEKSELHSASVEKTIKPKIKVFHDFGFSNSEIVEIIARQPKILYVSVKNKLIPSLCFVKDLLGSHDDLFRVVKSLGWFITSDMKNCVSPNIELFITHGVPMQHILWLFRRYPRFLFFTHDNARKHIERLENLGLEMDPSSKSYIQAFRVMASLSNEVWEDKMQVLRNTGFEDTKILDMFKRFPPVLTRSPEKLKDITEMVLSTEKYSKTSIVSFPIILCCSIEKTIKPRLEVLEVLEKMNLIKKWPSLGYVCSSKRFHGKYVAPFLNQLEEAYDVKKSLTTAAP